MAIEVLVLALNAKVGNSIKKAVLIGLANHAHPDGTKCFPSVRRLAAYAECGESTVRAKLRELRSESVIEIVKEATHHHPTEYKVNLHKLSTMEHEVITSLRRDRAVPPYMGVSDLQQLEASESEDLQQTKSDLQQTNGRPLGARGKPLKETLKDPSFNYEQSNFVQAKAIVLRNMTNNRPLADLAAKNYYRYYDPTWGFTMNGKGYVVCEGEDPEAQVEWLKSRGESFVNYWIGVNELEFITENQYKELVLEGKVDA